MAILHKIYSTITLIVLCSSINIAYALNNEEAILKAREAYEQKNTEALFVQVNLLNAQQDILAPYAEYWLMLLNLKTTSNEAIINFIEQNQSYPFVDSLRGAYLKKMGKIQDWASFADEFPKYQLKNTSVACYEAEANFVTGGSGALIPSRLVWLQGKDQPEACSRLFDHMQHANVITEDDVRARFRLALAANKVRLAKSIIKRSKLYDSAQIKQITLASKSPTLILNKKSISFNDVYDREMYLFALSRIARKDTNQALAKFNKIKQYFSKEESAYFYGRLALVAAKRHEINAITWFGLAGDTRLNTEQMAWYARSALRQKDWVKILSIIEEMEPSQAVAARWRYWKARALTAQPNKTEQHTEEANQLLADLSSERHYYGWLAHDGLANIPVEQPHYQASKAEVALMNDIPAVKRVEALNNVDLRWDAKREWMQIIQDFDDKQLIAAAGFANQKGWFDISIYAADETRGEHDFSLRYPMPYRDLVNVSAKQRNINEAWVYGITRQESRFMHYAKSRVGAAGLMQLMPATAKWAAPRAGLTNYKRSMINELETNIALGTFYLSYTLDKMGGFEPVASAAYNAGPSRAKKWIAEFPLEGAIYAETIPFNETRNYVQRVMANAHKYAEQMGLEKMTLKQRMGVVPGKLTYVSNKD